MAATVFSEAQLTKPVVAGERNVKPRPLRSESGLILLIVPVALAQMPSALAEGGGTAPPQDLGRKLLRICLGDSRV
jgi:hypothetical protein